MYVHFNIRKKPMVKLLQVELHSCICMCNLFCGQLFSIVQLFIKYVTITDSRGS